MSDHDHRTRGEPAERIEIDGDILLIDHLWHAEVLGGASRRTVKRLEADGLPFIYVAGRKYRPLKEGRRWLANRIERRNQPPKARRAAINKHQLERV